MMRCYVGAGRERGNRVMKPGPDVVCSSSAFCSGENGLQVSTMNFSGRQKVGILEIIAVIKDEVTR